MHNEKKTRRLTKTMVNSGVNLFLCLETAFLCFFSRINSQNILSSRRHRQRKKTNKEGRKKGRKEGKRRKKGKVKERRKEGRKKQVYKKKNRRSNNEKGPAQELILLPLY